MNILSLSTVFPRASDPRLGLFVRNRLIAMAEHATVKVVSPVAWLDASGRGLSAPWRGCPRTHTDGPLEVFHPRWLYLPGFGDFNGRLLEAAVGRGIARLRAGFKFDIIDAHFGFPEGVAAAGLARRLGVPYSVTLRGNETLHAASGRKRTLVAGALCAAAAVIAVSNRLRDFAIELGVRPERAHVIPNGIDGTVFHAIDRHTARRETGMAPDRLHIVSAGYLIERKGHHRIVEALPALAGGAKKCDLWIVGEGGKEGDFEHSIRDTVARLGLQDSVHFTGAVPPARLAAFFSAADLVCLASSREGWPNVVNEALACGSPVVASDVGGVPDMIDSPAFGRVVPPDDAAALRVALREALATEWNRRAIAARGAARAWSQVGAETLAVLEACTAGAAS